MAHSSIGKGDAWNSDAPDVRGWDVRDAEGHSLGKVDRVQVEKGQIAQVTLAEGRSYSVLDVRSGDHSVYVEAEAGTSASDASFESDYRRHFDEVYAGTGQRYEALQPAYAFGRRQALNAGFAGHTYKQVELDLHARYELEYPSHDYRDVAKAVQYGFERGQNTGPLAEKDALLDDEDAIRQIDRVQINTEGEAPSPEEAMQRAESMAVGPPPNQDTVHEGAGTDYSLYDERFKKHFDETYADQGAGYAGHESAYRLGLELARDERYQGKSFHEVDQHARQRLRTAPPEPLLRRGAGSRPPRLRAASVVAIRLQRSAISF